MKLILIAAVADGGVIGRSNTLPWYLPADLRRFKRLTTGHTVVMGRKTYESVGRPLPDRKNLVISGSKDFRPAGVTVVPSMEDALKLAKDDGDVFVIGGARVFEAALPVADRLELTRVQAAIPGDVYFPPFNPADWTLATEEKHPADDRNQYPYSFQTFERQKR
jgi:dihydrofolate reductase